MNGTEHSRFCDTMTGYKFVLSDVVHEPGTSPFPYLVPAVDKAWRASYEKRDAAGFIAALSERLDVWSQLGPHVDSITTHFRQAINSSLPHTDRLERMRSIAEIMDKAELNIMTELSPAVNKANMNALLLIAQEQDERVTAMSKVIRRRDRKGKKKVQEAAQHEFEEAARTEGTAQHEFEEAARTEGTAQHEFEEGVTRIEMPRCPITQVRPLSSLVSECLQNAGVEGCHAGTPARPHNSSRRLHI